MLPSDFCLPPAKLLGFAHFTSVVRIVGLSISPSFTIPGVQAWPVPAVEETSCSSERQAVHSAAKGHHHPNWQHNDYRRACRWFTSRLSVMPLSYCGRKAISRSPLPEWQGAGAGMVTFSNLYPVLCGQEQAEFASHFQPQHL